MSKKDLSFYFASRADVNLAYGSHDSSKKDLVDRGDHCFVPLKQFKLCTFFNKVYLNHSFRVYFKYANIFVQVMNDGKKIK